jgi:hypothetical protein
MKQLHKWCSKKEQILLHPLDHFCGMCAKYIHMTGAICSKCPLYKKWGMKCNCSVKSTPYGLWATSKTIKTRKKYAEQIYQDIKKI